MQIPLCKLLSVLRKLLGKNCFCMMLCVNFIVQITVGGLLCVYIVLCKLRCINYFLQIPQARLSCGSIQTRTFRLERQVSSDGHFLNLVVQGLNYYQLPTLCQDILEK